VNDVNAKAADSAVREHFIMLLPERGHLAGPLGRLNSMPRGMIRDGSAATARKKFLKYAPG
jgi:hypothetical protein